MKILRIILGPCLGRCLAAVAPISEPFQRCDGARATQGHSRRSRSRAFRHTYSQAAGALWFRMNVVSRLRTVSRYSVPSASGAFVMPRLVRTDRQIEIAVCFVEHERHPDGDEARRSPRVVVVSVLEVNIDDALAMQLTQPFSCEIRGAGKSDVAACIPIDQQPAMIERRFRHHDRRERVRDEAGRQRGPTAYI